MGNRKFLHISTFFLIVIQIWFLYVTFHYQFIGINVEKNSQNQWVVTSLSQTYEHADIGIIAGDIILKVDGQDPDRHATIKNFNSIEQAKLITISRNTEKLEFNVNPKSDTFKIYVYSIVGELLCLGVAFLLYMNSGGSQAARYLSLLFLVGGLLQMSLEAQARCDLLAIFIVSTLLPLVPFIFLHFLIVFFREKVALVYTTKFLYVIYGVVLVIKIPYLLGYTSLSVSQYSNVASNLMILFPIGFLLILLFLSHITYKFRKTKSLAASLLKTIWVAIIISFLPSTVFIFIPAVIWRITYGNFYFIASTLLVLPVTFCYLLFSKQVFSVDVIMRRILFAIISSILPCALIVGVVFLVFQDDFTFRRAMFCFFFILLIYSVGLYSMEYFTTKLEKIMFPQKYHLQVTLNKLSKEMGSLKNFRQLKDMVLVDIVETLQVEGAAIAIDKKGILEVIDEGEIDYYAIEDAVYASETSDSLYTKFEISQHEEYKSYLVLTPKKSRTIIHKEELQWLGLIMSNLAVSLENLYLIRKLSEKLEKMILQVSNLQEGNNITWFRKMMFTMQEKERMRISLDLHDTTMQDIFYLQRKLRALESAEPSGEKRKEIKSIIEHMDMVNVSLRQSCFELNPYMLEASGLLKTIKNLVDMEGSVSPFHLSFYTDWENDIESKDMDTKRHLFRVVQELINNAKKHSQASKVTISCTSEEDYFYLEYQDNGVGFDTGNADLFNKKSSGMGIEQIKGRVYDAGGFVQIQSGKGKGLQVQIEIPLREGGLTA